MDPTQGEDFFSWLHQQTQKSLEDILVRFGEEQNFRKIAEALKNLNAPLSGQALAESLLQKLKLRVSPREIYPLTRTFQALRIAINDELGELSKFLAWAPSCLNPEGRLAVISFHSLEDRKVKRAFAHADTDKFKVLTPKALTPTAKEMEQNFSLAQC